jgi:hypothetical protein
MSVPYSVRDTRSFQLSKVYGTSYLEDYNVAFTTPNAYQNISAGNWRSYGKPQPATLFPHNGSELIKFPRSGVYSVNVSCVSQGPSPGSKTRRLLIETRIPGGSWVPVKNDRFFDTLGSSSDVVYLYTNTVSIVLDVVEGTELRASLNMDLAGLILGDQAGNPNIVKCTSISVFNVD